MKRIKKILSIALATALLLPLASCGGSSAPSETKTAAASGAGDKVEIKFLHKWPQPENNAFFEEIVKSFEASHSNIKVSMEAVGDEPIKDKLRILMGTANQPDVFFSWSGEFAEKFVRSDNALNLTPYLDKNPDWKNSFMQAGLEPFTYNGQTYGIPYRINGKFFVYNKEMFEKNQLKKPETWAQFMEVLEKIKSTGVIPIAFGNIYPWAGCHYITGLNQKLVPQDTRLKDYNPKTGEFTDPGYVKALEYFKELNDKGYFNPGINSTEHNMASEMVFGGQAAMVYVELEEFADVEKKMNGNWDFFPMPAIDGAPGNQKFLTGAPDGFMVSAKSAHPDEAVEFLAYLTNKENSEKMVKALGWPSPVVGAVNPENAPEFLVRGLDGVAQAEGMALWLDTAISIKISDVYLPGLQEITNGDKTPQELMKEIQAVAKKVQSE